ncbi:MAG: TonB-dependent receptor plug domain-containing protein [Leptospiraceae bacterium]|nr:TonB-dependent receptor plug domain-containing protein [Leptospiraceae bacterium]
MKLCLIFTILILSINLWGQEIEKTQNKEEDIEIKKDKENQSKKEESSIQNGLAKEEEFFKLEEKIAIASNIKTDLKKQPVSISIISQDQIKMSGARTINELLTIYVPGFFMVEDHDDTIAGFRGFAPDNNAKVLLLINGHKLNTEWFWGPPDSLLNGLNMDYVQRIEVIRGPGSVTLGQGALLGVINIITKDANNSPGVSTGISQGANNFTKYFLQGSGSGKENPDLKVFLQYSSAKYNGQEIRSEGWAKAKTYDGTEGQYDVFKGRTAIIPNSELGNSDLVLGTHGNQSLITQRTISSGTQRIKRANQDILLGTIHYKNFEFTGLHSDQTRDLYNFYRDRNKLKNVVKNGQITHTFDVNNNITIKSKANYTQDDIFLKSLQGNTLGGTRETRYGGSVIFTLKDFPKNNEMALGVEIRKFDMGQSNQEHNNFILNYSDKSLLNSPNYNNRYVYPGSIAMSSLVLEDFYKISDKVDLFGAMRYDKHPHWGTNVAPRFGALYNPFSHLRFRFSYQEGFRGAVGVSYSGGFQGDGFLRIQNYPYIESSSIPNSYDSSGNPTNFYSSPSKTKPEKMKSYEFAISYDFLKYFHLESILFYNKMRNIIDVGVLYADANQYKMPNLGSDIPGDWNGYWFYKNSSGEIRQGGAEISLGYKSSRFQSTLSHSLVRLISASNSQFQSIYLSSDKNNQHFQGYPENVTRWVNHWKTTEKISLFLNYLFYPSWYSPRGNRVIGNHFINLGGYIKISQNIELGFILKNAINQLNLYPMISNAGGQDLSDGTPSVEKRTYWITLNCIF